MAELTDERLEAAAKHRLPAGMAERLRGATPEELEADARSIAEMFGRAGEEGPTSAEAVVIAQRELEQAKTRRLLGDGNTWREAGDE